ncbi:hypothetical protein FDG95_gp408 [Pectobacterium phage vB_PcaM_CBB]|uniref:Uncharacterized protein n=1 Tax=Pectobacterium phage vB_PcaM_CBB TaxID=2772511 RepID=A0A1L2CVT6_9CAUD|nr:hypothetical protein FDG95_gp018 [Pectobacterium phage vB_PcaM_CBB]YP_009595111.1 hypothetical protein FDG95_gp408 [Pectobacterium phage vB_PcaM_CBB]AMM43583.1 hypothetical protein CBB_18 [Pectobacterium phage vB_PcaM_CBB]AMM44134.1 hypothetical protein CBB_571 [Pectobacterium phage vB_PcaM_CBB]
MNPVYEIQADIFNTFSEIVTRGHDEESYKREQARIQNDINRLKLVRDRYACNTLMTSMFCNVMLRKMCLAYRYEGILYCTANNVPGRPNTDYLHTLNLTSDQWDSLKQFHVWISTGDVYAPVP